MRDYWKSAGVFLSLIIISALLLTACKAAVPASNASQETTAAPTLPETEYTVLHDVTEWNPEDLTRLTSTTVNEPSGIGTGIRLEFPSAKSSSVYSDSIENELTSGSSATLTINTCVWAPESNDLEIGIYNWTAGENWYVVASDGQVIDQTFTFTNLPAGSYSVYVRNCGNVELSTGYLLYSIA